MSYLIIAWTTVLLSSVLFQLNYGLTRVMYAGLGTSPIFITLCLDEN